jgi:hypothetical protein
MYKLLHVKQNIWLMNKMVLKPNNVIVKNMRNLLYLLEINLNAQIKKYQKTHLFHFFKNIKKLQTNIIQV